MAIKVETVGLERKYHDAVEHWTRHNFKDYPLLQKYWDKYFPSDESFCLCAKLEIGTSDTIGVGEFKGEKKRVKPGELTEEQAKHLLAIIRAQASTEFGSIQQHAGTIDRARDDEDKFWTMRVMAEELRHGYQMLHLLVEDDWSAATGQGSRDLVEEILDMRTGSHVLGAFNIDFDSFVDNVVFCALIDRVGKYQLAMQKVSAYSPMAESMPQMLREEAFHLAAGVVPLRRWVVKAAAGSPMITMDVIQRHLNKWVPRGLEMFGDERGGATNVRWGFKPMKNLEAQLQYHQECGKVVRDLNMRYLRARLPKLSLAEAEALIARLESERGSEQGVAYDDLLKLPHHDFFRRRGEPAFRKVGLTGETYETAGAYLDHLAAVLPDGYRATRDFRDFVEAIGAIERGEKTPEEAQKQMPQLRRVGGVCPCSRAVRWVADENVELPGSPAGGTVHGG